MNGAAVKFIARVAAVSPQHFRRAVVAAVLNVDWVRDAAVDYDLSDTIEAYCLDAPAHLPRGDIWKVERPLYLGVAWVRRP